MFGGVSQEWKDFFLGRPVVPGEGEDSTNRIGGVLNGDPAKRATAFRLFDKRLRKTAPGQADVCPSSSLEAEYRFLHEFGHRWEGDKGDTGMCSDPNVEKFDWQWKWESDTPRISPWFRLPKDGTVLRWRRVILPSVGMDRISDGDGRFEYHPPPSEIRSILVLPRRISSYSMYNHINIKKSIGLLHANVVLQSPSQDCT